MRRKYKNRNKEAKSIKEKVQIQTHWPPCTDIFKRVLRNVNFYPKNRKEKKHPYYRKLENVDTLIQLLHETNPGPKRSNTEKQQSRQIIMYFFESIDH